MWRFYNRFDFLNIYYTQHDGTGRGDKAQGCDSTTLPDKWQWWKGKSAIYRARIPPLTPPPQPPPNPHSCTPALLHVCLSTSPRLWPSLTVSIIYGIGIGFNFLSSDRMHYQGNDNLCEFRFRLSPYPNRRHHDQTLTEFGLIPVIYVRVTHVYTFVCMYVGMLCVYERALRNFGSSWEFSLYVLRPLKPEPQMSNWIPVLFNWFREHNEPGHWTRYKRPMLLQSGGDSGHMQ